MAGAQRWPKDHERRPELVLLGCAVVVPLAVAVGLLGLYRDWPGAVPAIAALVVAGATVAGAAAAWENGPRRSAALGAATIAVVLSALLVAGAAVLTQRPATAWLRFGLVVGAAAAALVLASADWSRRWLLRLSAFFVLTAVVLLVQIGQADLTSTRERRVLLTLSDAKHEGDGLDAAGGSIEPATPESATNPVPPGRDAANANFDAALHEACRSARHQGLFGDGERPTPVEATLDGCGEGEGPAEQGADAGAGVIPSATTEPADLDDSLYELNVTLARYRFITTGDDEDRRALLAALDSDPESRTTSYVDAAGRGPTALLESMTGSDRADRLTPGPVGWLTLGAFALLGWGALLRRNARQLAGPVLVEKLDEPKDYDADLRIAVLENVSEPGAVPGGGVITPVTELLSLSPAAGTVSKLVQTVFTVIGQSYGYRVEVVVDEPNGQPGAATGGPGAGDPARPAPATRVLVRVKDLRSSTTLAGHVESGPDTGTAVRAAGLWAAGFILDESSRVPSWAAWTAETARSLATGREGTPSLDVLKEAVRGSPNSGMLLVRLGQAHELAREPIEAVNCYAQAAAAHPTYLLARYRLAAAIAMLGRTIGKTWPTLGPQRRDEIVEALRRACRTLPPKARQRAETQLDDLRSGAGGGDGSRPCYAFAREFLREVEYQTGAVGLLTTSLRREDRDDRMPLLWSTGPAGARQQVRWLARSARLSCSAIIETDPTGRRAALHELRDKADQRGTWWQVGYNAACAHCLAGQPGTAITLLEECLLHPGSHQLRRGWLTADPDLESIQQSPRFRRLVERVAEGDRRA